MDKSNLLKRAVSAVILIPIVLFCIVQGGYFYLGFALFMTLLSSYEFIKISSAKNAYPNLVLTYFSAIIFPYLFMYGEFELICIVLIALMAFSQFSELRSPSENPILSTASSFLSFGYISLFISVSVYIREFYAVIFKTDSSHGGMFVLMIFIGIWACDTFAYFGGSAYGKRKLYEKVSPKKSIEGAITGFLGTIIVIQVFHYYYLPELSNSLVIILTFVIGVGGQIGDLIESLYKRDSGIKDSGTTIPGHGGVLDRLDSFIYVSPLIFITIKLYEYFV
jgi:phosphatidate cytidylyltransferase